MQLPNATDAHNATSLKSYGFRLLRLSHTKSKFVKHAGIQIIRSCSCLYPVNDPQAVYDPRPDVSYQVSGQSGLQLNLTGVGPDGFGSPELGSRVIQWGWNPVGGARGPDAGLTPNDLAQAVVVGTVTVEIT